MRHLSYVSENDPAWKRWIMVTVEDLSGRRRYLPLYRRWREMVANNPNSMMRDMLALVKVKLKIHSKNAWPYDVASREPLVLIANHPFGLADGIVALALAESLRRPYRVLINRELLAIPEFRPFALPIDFSKTRDAIATNLTSRAEARRLACEGVTIVIFPAGGVATATSPFGQAEELPWKTFTARLVQQTKSSVIPIYFAGQNSFLFHAASRVSLSLRLSLMVSEFRNFPGRSFSAYVGNVVPFDAMPGRNDRQTLIEELYLMVHRLAPESKGCSDMDLLPRPVEARPRFPWQ